jgi:hypothetical protein
MKHVVIAIALFSVACSHGIVKSEYDQDHSARNLTTTLDHQESANSETVGVRSGDLIVQKKQLLTEELRDLMIAVYTLQDQVYGTEAYRTEGALGLLRACKVKLASKYNGGDGKFVWTEPVDRIADKDQDVAVGLDEQKKLVAVSEEYISDRITRFRDYKRILTERRDRIESLVDSCHSDLEAQLYSLSHKESIAGQ